jgi:hypothetical protein
MDGHSHHLLSPRLNDAHVLSIHDKTRAMDLRGCKGSFWLTLHGDDGQQLLCAQMLGREHLQPMHGAPEKEDQD